MGHKMDMQEQSEDVQEVNLDQSEVINNPEDDPVSETPPDAEDSQDHDDIEDEVTVSIGDDQPKDEKPAPRWVRELRKSQRELARENRELKMRLESTASTENKPVQLGPKPTLDGCDYDTEAFEAKLAEWFDQKRELDHAANKMREAEEAEKKEWQNKLNSYAKSKAELRVRDYEDAEEAVQGVLDVTQQSILIEGAENPAVLVYALGKNPQKAREFASIKSPIKFAFAVAKLEKELKVIAKGKQAPAPEKIVSGTARISGSTDVHLDRLREKAAKTNDYSEVNAYKKQLRDKQKR